MRSESGKVLAYSCLGTLASERRIWPSLLLVHGSGVVTALGDRSCRVERSYASDLQLGAAARAELEYLERSDIRIRIDPDRASLLAGCLEINTRMRGPH